MLVLKSCAWLKVTFKLVGDSAHSVSPPPHTRTLLTPSERLVRCVRVLPGIPQRACVHRSSRIYALHDHLVGSLQRPASISATAGKTLSCPCGACAQPLGVVSPVEACAMGVDSFAGGGRCPPAWASVPHDPVWEGFPPSPFSPAFGVIRLSNV